MLITFALIKALPGDPAISLVGERAKPETIERIKKELGTDKGFISQFAGYIALILKGDFGRSYYTQRDVAKDIAQKFPNTIKLALAAMLIAAPPGIVFGVFSAKNKARFFDRAVSALTICGISLPVFWMGLILMYLFSLYLKWLPPSGTGDLRFMVLPAITLAIPAWASIARITRTTALEIINEPFIRTGRAKGLKESAIFLRHVLKNVMIPLVTIIGLDFGSYLNGAVLTETIFGWDGIGRFIMEGIIKRDYPVVMGCLIIGTVVFVSINIVVDILYHYLDPRIRVIGKN
ncbi:MAG: ABC transporter permease [Nitrospirae bacterium]|nr:ABC transporter permease [Nitrospirota bacterium]